MSSETFVACTTILPGERADALRTAYIQRFVKTESAYFREYIAQKRQFSDGEYCFGYLWDTLRNPTTISEEQLKAELAQRGEVYVFWDLHSAEHQVAKDYWKFPREAVLRVQAPCLIEAIASMEYVAQGWAYLPEDIYIFDDS